MLGLTINHFSKGAPGFISKVSYYIRAFPGCWWLCAVNCADDVPKRGVSWQCCNYLRTCGFASPWHCEKNNINNGFNYCATSRKTWTITTKEEKTCKFEMNTLIKFWYFNCSISKLFNDNLMETYHLVPRQIYITSYARVHKGWTFQINWNGVL